MKQCLTKGSAPPPPKKLRLLKATLALAEFIDETKATLDRVQDA